MSNEVMTDNSTNNAVTVAPSDPSGEIKTLKDQLERYKGTQAALDRAKSQLTAEKEALLKERDELKVQLSAFESDAQHKSSELVKMQAQLAELQGFRDAATHTAAELERWKVVAQMSGKNPAVALLAETGALPATQSIEDFKVTLQKIVDGLGVLSNEAATQKLSGALPPTQPVGDSVAWQELERKGYELIKKRQSEEGLRLIQQAAKLKAQQTTK